MNIEPVFNTQRQMAEEAFNKIHMHAKIGNLSARLYARKATLTCFTDCQQPASPNRKYLGLQDIPVKQITGSFNRANDYDYSFRPLKRHLRERWVSLFLSLQTGSWEPIRVFKIGTEYFVEDGHHRVSVARFAGTAFILAEVWEYKPIDQTECDHPGKLQ